MRDEDLAAIERTACLYMQGMHEADAAKLNAAFHPTARIQGYRGGEWRSLTREQFVSYAAGLGPREAAGERFDMRIVSIDRAGRAAVVKVAMRWNGRDYVDFLSMIRRDEDGWTVSEKTFHSPT
ncbi:nuclear transport factor 2 family protein [Falsiroseomonas sp. HW251]|uniref:nuclear transport factor 2 family protein n=1 Tax=Falsiroseomonas sp. HW251 TaxID=3390998 RepID=UPI003D31FB60